MKKNRQWEKHIFEEHAKSLREFIGRKMRE